MPRQCRLRQNGGFYGRLYHGKRLHGLCKRNLYAVYERGRVYGVYGRTIGKTDIGYHPPFEGMCKKTTGKDKLAGTAHGSPASFGAWILTGCLRCFLPKDVCPGRRCLLPDFQQLCFQFVLDPV